MSTGLTVNSLHVQDKITIRRLSQNKENYLDDLEI